MIQLFVSDESAMLVIGAEFMNGKMFYATYQNGNFYCRPANPGLLGGTPKSFFIDSLNEESIIARALQAAAGQNKQSFESKKFFKGTTFGGVTENAFGFIAALLKEGLGNTEIHIGVKLKWTAADLLKYINAIQEKTLTLQTI